MINHFIEYLNQFVTLEAADRQIIHEVTRIKKVEKGDFLLQEGEISKSFYFNLSGLVRLFYLKSGEEKTAYFFPKNTFISAYSSFLKAIPSEINLQAVESTHLVEINTDASMRLLEHSSKFEALARIAMEDELMNYQEIVASLISLKPEERYYNLLQKNPEIFQKVPQHQIASFIGVQPESLSRIKKRLLKKS